MPDVRFLTEASFLIGVGVGGLPLLTIGYALGRWARAELAPGVPVSVYGVPVRKEKTWTNSNRVQRMTEPRIIAFRTTQNTSRTDSSITSDAAVVGAVRAPLLYQRQSPPGTAAPNRRTLNRLEAAIRNNYGSEGQRIPPEGVQLSHPFLKRARISDADDLRAYILRRGHGYSAPSGGGETVYLNKENALAFLKRQSENRRKK